MTKEVKFEALWKVCVNGWTERQIKIFGQDGIKKLKQIKPYEYKAGLKYVKDVLDVTDVDEINYENSLKLFEYIYFYRYAKKPNFILTLLKKYLY